MIDNVDTLLASLHHSTLEGHLLDKSPKGLDLPGTCSNRITIDSKAGIQYTTVVCSNSLQTGLEKAGQNFVFV